MARNAITRVLTESTVDDDGKFTLDIVLAVMESGKRYAYRAVCQKVAGEFLGNAIISKNFKVGLRKVSPKVLYRNWLTFHPDNTKLTWSERPKLWDDALERELFTCRQEWILKRQAIETSNNLTMSLPRELVTSIWSLVENDRCFLLLDMLHPKDAECPVDCGTGKRCLHMYAEDYTFLI